ncbi:MAG: D-aminoacyl-tRNA deacylase [Myxococcota bacterium]
MRAVAQRVLSARVAVGDAVVGEMGAGLLALVGVGQNDSPEQAAELARKLVHLRIFGDDEGRMNRSLLDTGGSLGVVSQFTLFGDARHGRRPSFVAACPAQRAEPLIDAVVESARELGVTVMTGRFQASMELALVNSGPVTILLDTDKVF